MSGHYTTFDFMPAHALIGLGYRMDQRGNCPLLCASPLEVTKSEISLFFCRCRAALLPIPEPKPLREQVKLRRLSMLPRETSGRTSCASPSLVGANKRQLQLRRRNTSPKFTPPSSKDKALIYRNWRQAECEAQLMLSRCETEDSNRFPSSRKPTWKSAE